MGDEPHYTFDVLVIDYAAAQALGTGVPVVACGMFTSREAFARALIAVGLERDDIESAVIYRISMYARSVPPLPGVTDPGRVYVMPVDSLQPLLPWPPEEA